jgi:hypothetical protein
MNRASVAAGVPPAVEGGVPPPGILGSWSVSRFGFESWGLSMNLPMQAIARVEPGSLTPALSRGERVSRPALGDMPEPRPSEPSRIAPANARLALRNPRRRFSFSLREKAGMRAARSTPRAPVHGPSLFTFLLALFLTGCGGSNDDSAGVATPQQAATQIDEAFTTAEPELQQNIQVASEALREGKFEQAVVALQVTRNSTNLTLDQGMAVHNSMITLEQHLINAAANGDANAQRAYDLLKKSKRN